MPTDDERREVARRLRSEKCAWVIWVSAVCLAIGVDGETDGNDILDRLADLIEPDPERTCRIVENEEGHSSCSECGASYLCMADASYCPDCGAKVVE